MKKAARDIGAAIRIANDIQRLPLIEMLSTYDDELWSLFIKKLAPGLPDYVERFELARFLIIIGDRRFINHERLLKSLIDGIEFLRNRERVSRPQINLVQNLQRQTQKLIMIEKVNFTENNQINIEKITYTLEQALNKLIRKFR